jgi:hypothetical protein
LQPPPALILLRSGAPGPTLRPVPAIPQGVAVSVSDCVAGWQSLLPLTFTPSPRPPSGAP